MHTVKTHQLRAVCVRMWEEVEWKQNAAAVHKPGASQHHKPGNPTLTLWGTVSRGRVWTSLGRKFIEWFWCTFVTTWLERDFPFLWSHYCSQWTVMGRYCMWLEMTHQRLCRRRSSKGGPQQVRAEPSEEMCGCNPSLQGGMWANSDQGAWAVVVAHVSPVYTPVCACLK